MKAFIYNGRTYLRLIPGKNLFKSTMVHEVVNRGDVFGMDIESQVFTIIPGKASVEHIDIHAMPSVATIAKEMKATSSLGKMAAPVFVDLFSDLENEPR